MVRKNKEWTAQDEFNEFQLIVTLQHLAERIDSFVQFFEVKMKSNFHMVRYFWPYLGSNEFEGALPLRRVYPG